MKAARLGCLWLALSVAVPAVGQEPGRLELVRCAAASDIPCFQPRETPGAPLQVVGVGPDGIAGLGRGAVRRVIVQGVGADTVVAVLSWRPPLIAMPAFRGVADSSRLAPAIRDALTIGTLGGSNRPVISLLLAILIGFVWLAVRRLGWDDPEPVKAREREMTTRTTIAGSPDDEAPPRRPEDVTRQTARRTALRR